MTIDFLPIEPALLTITEAAKFLRLDTDGGDGVRAIRRYVSRGLIRPCRVGRSNRFAITELRRFIQDRTEARGA